MQMFDPYDVLGLPRSASASSIKLAYRQRARLTHPDRGGESEDFIVVVKAFGVLSDPEAKRLFDETGQISDEGTRNYRQDVAVLLAEMFDTAVATALSLGLPLETVNFIRQMRTAVEKQSEEAKAESAKLQQQLEALDALKARIRRRDEAPNLFVQRLDEQVKAKLNARTLAARRLALFEAAITELSNYDSEVELFAALEV